MSLNTFKDQQQCRRNGPVFGELSKASRPFLTLWTEDLRRADAHVGERIGNWQQR